MKPDLATVELVADRHDVVETTIHATSESEALIAVRLAHYRYLVAELNTAALKLRDYQTRCEYLAAMEGNDLDRDIISLVS